MVNLAKSFLKTSQESRKWLVFSTQCYLVLLSSPLSPSQKNVRLIRAENKRMQLCLQIELSEQKSQSLYLYKSLRWEQQIYVTNEKNRYSEYYYKNFVCRPEIGPKHFVKLKPNPPEPKIPARLTSFIWCLNSSVYHRSYICNWRVNVGLKSSRHVRLCKILSTRICTLFFVHECLANKLINY